MLRRAALLLVLCAPGTAVRAEEPHRFRECAFEWIPWATTIEEARERSKKDRKPILAFVFPWDGKAFEAGYEGAETVRKGAPATEPAELEAQRTSDPGFVKEQAALTVLLGHPDVSALVARTFVPLRLRMHTWHFFDGGPGPLADPLPDLGTTVRETRPPALLIVTPEGKLLHRMDRIGVFNPHHLHRTLLHLLGKGARLQGPPPRPDADFRTAVLELAASGSLEQARRRLASAPAEQAGWAAVMRARLDASEGKVKEADTALAALMPSPERDALLAEVRVRSGRFGDVAAMPGLAEGRGRIALAYALVRLGRSDEAMVLWSRTLAAEPQGPVAARARLHLAIDGPRAREWETLESDTSDPLSPSTVRGTGGEAPAVRYLLGQQAGDGSWKDPRGAPGPNDLSVPRTALCVCALRAWRTTVSEPGLDDAVRRGTDYVDRWSDAPTSQVWSLTYALHLELELLAESPSPDRRRRAEALLAALGTSEHDGGWSYTAPPRLHTFNTAPILLLLARAKELGLAVGPAQIERAVKFLQRNRVPKTRIFHYGTTMEHMSGEKKGATDVKSTCMRSPVCELALHAAGAEADTSGIAEAIDLFFEHQASVRATQKIFESYVDVTSLQDSYRYFFGAWYVAQGILRLPEARQRKPAQRLDQLLRAAQEIDGSFVDSQMVGKSSSTALALLALAQVRPLLR